MERNRSTKKEKQIERKHREGYAHRKTSTLMGGKTDVEKVTAGRYGKTMLRK
jgi:hypothetical protein